MMTMLMMSMMMMKMMITFSVECLLTSRGGGRAEVAVDKVEMCRTNKQMKDHDKQTNNNAIEDRDKHTEVENEHI